MCLTLRGDGYTTNKKRTSERKKEKQPRHKWSDNVIWSTKFPAKLFGCKENVWPQIAARNEQIERKRAKIEIYTYICRREASARILTRYQSVCIFLPSRRTMKTNSQVKLQRYSNIINMLNNSEPTKLFAFSTNCFCIVLLLLLCSAVHELDCASHLSDFQRNRK